MTKRSLLDRIALPIAAVDRDARGWLGRVALSLALALLAGALAYLVARAIGGVALFAQQQDLLRAAAGALQGGVEGLGGGNFHEARMRLAQLDARNQQLSLLISFASAGLAAVASYLWLERRAED